MSDLYSAHPRRRTVSLASGMLLLAAIVLLLSACDSRPSGAQARASTPSSAAHFSFPTFSDWRVVYVDSSFHVHATSLDVKQDMTGPTLSNLASAPSRSAAISPDGHWLAYSCVPGVCILDLTGQYGPVIYKGVPPELSSVPRGFAWSPDSSALAVDDGEAAVPDDHNLEGIITVPSGEVHPAPAVTHAYFDLVGWVDSTHLAGSYVIQGPIPTPAPTSTPRSDASSPPSSQTATLAAEDITTGAVRTVWSLTSSTLASWYFLLAPDGKHALFYNTPFRDYPYRPDMRLIDIATGNVTPLPAIAQALGRGPGIGSIVWRGGTMTLAASNDELQAWTLDLQHDEARLLPYTGVVEGWAPDSDTLVLMSRPYEWSYEGTYMLTAVAGARAGSGAPHALTTGVHQLWFAGFARTAT